jgi:hypothetical protein
MDADSFFEFCSRTSGVAAWVSVLLAVVAIKAVVEWGKAKAASLRGVHKLPVVRATVWTAWQAAIVIGMGIGADRYFNRRAALAEHKLPDVSLQPRDAEPLANEHAEQKGPGGGGEADPSEVVRGQDNPAPRVAAKPIIRDGKISHRNQAFSEFEPDPNHPGYLRCKRCKQSGQYQQVNGDWQFVEVEFAPEPPK